MTGQRNMIAVHHLDNSRSQRVLHKGGPFEPMR